MWKFFATAEKLWDSCLAKGISVIIIRTKTLKFSSLFCFNVIRVLSVVVQAFEDIVTKRQLKNERSVPEQWCRDLLRVRRCEEKKKTSLRFSRLQPTPKMKENDFPRVSGFFSTFFFIVFKFYRSAAKRKKKNKQEKNVWTWKIVLREEKSARNILLAKNWWIRNQMASDHGFLI